MPEDGGFTLPPADAVDVNVSLNTTNGAATVTFTVNNGLDGDTFQLFSVVFSVNGGFTIGSTSVTGGTVPSTTISNGSLDNLGMFSEDPTTHSDTQVALVLNPTGGVSQWTSASNVLAGSTGCNAGLYPGECPFLAAAQVKIFDSMGTQLSQGGKSDLDLAGNGTVPGSIPGSVPEPASVALFGSVLAAVVGVFRKKLSPRSTAAHVVLEAASPSQPSWREHAASGFADKK